MNKTQFAVDDEVGVYSSGRSFSSGTVHSIQKVVKINGHGHVTLDNGRVFDKHDNEYIPGRTQDRYASWRSMIIPAARAREIIAEAEQRKKHRDNSVKLMELLSKRAHNGIIYLNEADIIEAKLLLEMLPSG